MSDDKKTRQDHSKEQSGTSAMIQPKTLLMRLWIGFSTISTVVSIASIFDDIVEWVQFVQHIIVAYRQLVDAVWGPMLGLLPFHLPRWTHDYLTISSLMGVSILWALHKSGAKFGVGGMQTLLSAVRRTALDFTVGGNSFELIGSSCRKMIREQGLSISHEIEKAIQCISRKERTGFLVIDGIAAAVFIVASAILMPMLIPPFLSYRDNLETRRAYAAMTRRRNEASTLSLDANLVDIITKEIDSSARSYASVEALNKLYHSEIRKQIFYYYAAVAICFFILVFINYAINRFHDVKTF